MRGRRSLWSASTRLAITMDIEIHYILISAHELYYINIYLPLVAEYAVSNARKFIGIAFIIPGMALWRCPIDI